MFENTKNTEIFHKLIFLGMICSDLEYFSKHSVYVGQNFQGITQNYQCKPSNEVEISFVCSWSQNGMYIPNWLLFSSFLAISNVSNG